MKKPGALVALLTSKSGGEESMGDDMKEEPLGAHEAAFNSYATAVGIPAENKARAQAALKEFVKACMREYGPEEE